MHDFLFKDVKHFGRNSISVSEFKGKFLILDFFTTGCAACFESLPKINHIGAKFKDKVQIIMVGLNERNLQSIYDAYRIKWKLDLPVVYLNRNEWSKFEIFGVPHILVVDPEGIVRAITHTISENDLQLFLAGKDPHFLSKFTADQVDNMDEKYTWRLPFLVNGNGASDSSVVFRSLLTKWSGSITSSFNPDCMADMNTMAESNGDKMTSRLEVVGYDLRRLYRIAYGDTLSHSFGQYDNVYGKMWPYPVLELRDSADFIFSTNFAGNRYNYSLIIPKQNLVAMQTAMQHDLATYFGFDAGVEQRLMPCWNLVSTEAGRRKLKSAGRKFSKLPTDRTDIKLVDKPISSLVEQLYFCFPNGDPIIDLTGISTNIDIYVEGLKNDLQDIRAGLQKNGLDLVKSEKMMKVVVIRDPKTEPSSK